MKSLVSAIAVVGIALVLIYFLVPVDVYYAQSPISGAIFRLADFLNRSVPVFPSKIILYLEGQQYLGFMRYLDSAKMLAVLFLPGIFLGRKKLNWWLFLGPLVFLEIVYRLKLHDIDSVLLKPFFVIFIFFVVKKLKLAILLTFLAAIFLTFDSWLPVLENFVYNRLLLWLLPIRLFEDLNILLVILMVIFLIGAERATRIIMIGYIVATILLPSGQRWIWAKENSNDQYLLLTKEFIWPGFLPKNLQIQISAKSVYKLYINGNYVGEGPGPNDDRRRYFDQYDAGKWLKPGRNEIKILAYNYGHDTHFQKKQTGGVWANFVFSIGPVRLDLPTNKTWLMTSQTGYRQVNLPTVAIKDFEINSGIYHEEFDFGIKQKKYILATESPVSEHLIKKDYPTLVSDLVEPIKFDGQWVEFANVVAGFPEFSFETTGPAVVEAKYFEEPGSSSVEWDDFYLPGPGKYYHEGFGRRGFRVVQLVAKEGKVDKIGMAMRTIRYPAPTVGAFSSDDPELEKYWQIGVDTLRYGLQDQYEDSFVHERSQYLGDSYVDMLAGFYSLNSQELARKALYQFASSQRAGGVIETVYPSGLNQTIISYNLMFAQFLKQYYFYTGDRKTVTDLLPTARRIVEGVTGLFNDRGLISVDSWPKLGYTGELVGWVDHSDRPQGAPDVNLSLDALYYQELLAIADLSGRDYGEADNFKKRLAADVSNRPLESIEPHAAVLLINSGVLDPETEKKLYEAVLRNQKWPFVTAYFDLFYLQAMDKLGDVSGMRRVLSEQWGGMINEGARTTWDVFDPLSPGEAMASRTHAWSSGATYFLTASGVGIRPLDAGYKKILIRPNLLAQKMAGTVDTACGKIAVDWELTAADYRLNLKTSCHSPRRFELPFPSERVTSVVVDGQQVVPEFSGGRLIFESAGNDEIETISVGLRG